VLDITINIFSEVIGLLTIACFITGALIWLAKKIPLLKLRPFLSGWIITTTLWIILTAFPTFVISILAPAALTEIEYSNIYTEFYLAFYPTTVIALLYYIRDLKANFRKVLGE